MKTYAEVIKETRQIYRAYYGQAEEYLTKARRLKKLCGPAFAIIYCWFFSIPQRWIKLEPKIFEFGERTRNFDLETILKTSTGEIAEALKPMIFHNEISRQLKNFCAMIKNEYSSWQKFAEVLTQENIFDLFKKFRMHNGIRITFKNLAAMKIFVGMENDLLIPDTHLAKILGLNIRELARCKTRELHFRRLLNFSKQVTDALQSEFDNVSLAKWSLAIWFSQTKVLPSQLLA